MILKPLQRISKLLTHNAPVVKKEWSRSQDYEWNAAKEFMETTFFHQIAAEFSSGDLKFSRGYRDTSLITEFFAGSNLEYENFLEDIKGKSCLDIGPCISSPLSQWDHTGESFIIEPLIDKVEKWQIEEFGFSFFDGLHTINAPAEYTQEKLIGKIDGAIFCRNCIDHSPLWPFILGNIARYASQNCYLLLWTDLDHGSEADEGHYDIVKEPQLFKNLIESFGFDIIHEYSDLKREGVNWGCLAKKL